jgi:hypothetical protein
MAMAFKPGEGPLIDPNLEPSEQEGVMYLYTGPDRRVQEYVEPPPD